MKTLEDGHTLFSEHPRGLEGSPFDLIDEGLMDNEGYYDVLIRFPRDEWESCADEYDQLELINEYTFPDWCIQSSTWDEVEEQPNGNIVAVLARIQPDLSD